MERYQGSENYRDPSTTRQLLRQTTARRKKRGRIFLVAGFAVPFVALLIWGTVTMIQFAVNESIPPSAETVDTMAGPGSADSGQPLANPDTAAPSLEPATGKLDLSTAVSPADERDLAAAQHQIGRLSAALDTQLGAALDSAANSDTRTAGARADTARLHTENLRLTEALAEATTGATDFRVALQQAKNQTDAKRQDLTLAATVSLARVADLQRELKSAHQQITKLSRVRVAANADASGLRSSLQQAEEQTDAIRQELTLAVTASSARLSTLQKELRTGQQRIANLSKAAEAAEDEAAKLREELAARQQVPVATQLLTAPSDQNPVADQKDADQTQDAEYVETAPEFEEILTAAEMSSNPVTSEMAALRDTVSPDDLLLEPGHHVGREVVVIGSVVWLLRRYWLQSDSGHMSMWIDVKGLQLDDRNKLKDAVVQIEFLAQARARITGTVERQGSETYHIAATEMVLVE